MLKLKLKSIDQVWNNLLLPRIVGIMYVIVDCTVFGGMKRFRSRLFIYSSEE